MRARRATIALSLVGVGLTLSLSAPREGAASRARSSAMRDALPLRQGDAARLSATLHAPGALALASLSVSSAARSASLTATAHQERHAFKRVWRDSARGDAARAEAQLRALIEHHLAAAKRDAPGARDDLARAQLALASLLLQHGLPSETLATLASVSQSTPVEDYRGWLHGEALELLGRHEEAAVIFGRVAAMPTSPMAHRARVRRAHNLYDAGQWAAAAGALKEVNTLYPDYPRRYVALSQHARALLKLGKDAEAVPMLQELWTIFPFRAQGRAAKQRLDALQGRGVVVPQLSLEARYAHIRRLRIDKHWDTARELFEALRQEAVEARGAHAGIVHEIDLQLALNAYIPAHYDEALGHLERLKAAWDEGHRDGIDQDSLFSWYASTLAKFGRFDEAVKALSTARSRQSARAQALALAELHREHGRYVQARALMEPVLTPSERNSWAYTWLLYKTNDFKLAREGFEAYAARRSGRERARGLYWSARAAEREGLRREARAIYELVVREHGNDYYGLQATNRLHDASTRQDQREVLAAQTAQVQRSAELALGAFDHAARPNRASDAPPPDLLRMARAEQKTTQDTSPLASIVLTPTLCEHDAQALQTPVVGASMLCQLAQATASPTKLARRPDLDDDAVHAGEAPAARLAAAPAVAEDAALRVRPYDSPDHRARLSYPAQARIHWDGPKNSALTFVRHDVEGAAVGPLPEDLRAYDEEDYLGGLDRALEASQGLFPQLERARWLLDMGLIKQARWAARDVALEYRELSRRPRPSSAPHLLPQTRMTPLIDNRRNKSSTWGYVEREARWPVATEARARAAQLERQRAIISSHKALLPHIVDALKEVGDYFMVRKLTQERRVGRGRQRQMQLYPRAFPDLVVPAARQFGVNPYLIWALMIVESSFNPDSVSTAEALGLLQVIPRTGLKIAELLGDDRFGHYDLLDEDVAVLHGAFYIGQVIRKFHGQELFAFAGYNGGPHRVAEWLDQRGDMPLDEFVEEIPFDQAREYTKKVTYFLALYLRLYEGVDTLYIGQNVRRDYQPMPNF